MTFPCDEATARSAAWFYAALIVVTALGSAIAGIMSWPGFVAVIVLAIAILVVFAVTAFIDRWREGNSERQ